MRQPEGERRLLRGGMAAALAVVACLGGQPQAWAQPTRACATPSELVALQLRVLQTELMVAALACDQHQQYNQFATIFRAELLDQGGALRRYFARTHARESAPWLNGLVTRLANEASQRTYQNGFFCAEAEAAFQQVLGAKGGELARFAATRPTATTHGVAPCTLEADARPVTHPPEPVAD